MVEIIPGIYDQDISEIERRIALVAPFVQNIQLDISDGTLVRKKSVYKAEILSPVIAAYPKLVFEAHLMVNNPENYVSPFARIGFRRLIAHIEAEDFRHFLDEAQYEDVETGIAIDAPSEITLAEPFIDHVDMILVMTAEAGASGQPFMMDSLEKIKQLREGYPQMPIEVDCGINAQTARLVKDAGATRLASTSFIFNNNQGVYAAIKALIDA